MNKDLQFIYLSFFNAANWEISYVGQCDTSILFAFKYIFRKSVFKDVDFPDYFVTSSHIVVL